MDHHGHSRAEETQITLNVEGMTCAHCAMTVTKVLENNGADHPSVNYATGEASFSLDNKQELNKIIEGIQKAGYKVVSQSEAEAHTKGLAPVEKKFLFTLPFTIPLFFSHMIFSQDFVLNQPLVQLVICVPVFIIGLMYFGKSAWSSIKTGAPNMDVLIMIGSGAAFIYSIIGMILYQNTHEAHHYLFFETTSTIITLVLLGNVIEHRSVKQTTSAISELSKLQTSVAKKVMLHNGTEMIHEVEVKEILVGDILMVNTGDKIPVDGLLLSGNISIDESMITGESVPVEKSKGEKVIGGTIAVSGNMRMLAEKIGKETMLSKIIELVKNAQQAKPKIQKLGDKISNIFVPVVLVISLLTFFVCYLFFDTSVQKAMMNSIAVLVISCPCAMGLATPTAVMVGIGRAARKGILIKGGASLEQFAKVKSVVFDKTGTLTTGKFIIKNIEALKGASEGEIESVLFHIEQRSSHPIAKSLVDELSKKIISPVSFSQVNEIKGVGLEAKTLDGFVYKVGSHRLLSESKTNPRHSLYILKNDVLIGVVDLKDEIKYGSKDVISFLLSLNITPILLSGDTKERCQEIAAQLGIKEVYSEQLPQQKLEIIDHLAKSGHVAMVGDGINDAPALAKAEVGISIGNATQAAIHSSMIVLLNEKDILQLKTAYLISKHTLKTIKQNLFWAFFYNVVAIPIAAAGFLSPMIGALAMAFSDVIVIGNSLRLKIRKLN